MGWFLPLLALGGGAYSVNSFLDQGFDVYGRKSNLERDIAEFAKSAGRDVAPQIGAEIDAERLNAIAEGLPTVSVGASPYLQAGREQEFLQQLERTNRAELALVSQAVRAGASPTYLEKLAALGLL